MDFSKLKNQKPSINVVLLNIHKELFANMKNLTNQEDADFLTDFLQTYIDKARLVASRSNNLTWDNIEDDMGVAIVAKAIDEQVKNGRKASALFGNSIRSGVNQGNYAYKAGLTFEEDFADLIQGIRAVYGQSTNRQDILIGNETAIPTILNNIQNFTNKEMLNMFKKYKNKYLNSKNPEQNIARAGKIDVRGGDGPVLTLSMVEQKNEKLLKAYNLLARSNFSLKNYKSGGHDKSSGKWIEDKLADANIHLGRSNSVKAIFSVLGALGASEEEAEKGFMRMYECYVRQHSHSDETAKHIYDIRYIYELSGFGLQYTNPNLNSIGSVDFLIWNDTTTQKIYVESVTVLLSELFDDTNKGNNKKRNPFGDINISKTHIRNRKRAIS